MPTTRSKSSPKPATKAGTKRASDSATSAPSKRGRPSKKEKKEQQEIKESTKDNKDNVKVPDQTDKKPEKKGDQVDADKDREQKPIKEEEAKEKNGEKTADTEEAKEAVKEEQEQKPGNLKRSESVVKDEEREAEIPSNILEKGIIYFFFRPRVGVEDPHSISDVARGFIVLRPLPLGAKLGEGTLEDLGNARLLALPKKVLPKSHRDRFWAFVEKASSSIKDLREQFASSEHETKTAGTRHVPAATPVAEGVYAITSTPRASHLAYQTTYPELGEVQKEFGIHEQGSYIISVKNPKFPSPVSLGKTAEYPEDLKEKFRDLRWIPLQPEFLDYVNTQLLLIGEGLGTLGKAIEEEGKDLKEEGRETPEEEIEKLEDEDHIRVAHLKQDDPVFADLGLSSNEYQKMQTTW